MKLIQFFCFLFLFTCYSVCKLTAQNVGVNSTGSMPHPSAILDVDANPANNKGVLLPRIALLATNNPLPVTAPATSLLIYNIATASSGITAVTPGYYYWDGTQWVALIADDWHILGNTGTTPATHFIGTIDAQDLAFRTNNTEYLKLTTTGILINNLFSNALGVDAQGISNNSLGFQNNQGAFTASFYNTYSGDYSNGVLIKSLSTSSLSTLLDISTGVVNAINTPILIAKAHGNIGVNTANPTTKLHVVSTTSNTAFRMQDGTEGAGKVLTSDANGAASWARPIGGWIGALDVGATAGNQSIPTQILFTSAIEQPNLAACNVGTSAITIPYSGIYRVTINGHGGGVNSPYLIAFDLRKNGGGVWTPHYSQPNPGWGADISVQKFMVFAAGDVLTLFTHTAFSGGQAIGIDSAQFSVEYIK